MTTVYVSAKDQNFATLLGAAIRRRSGHPLRIALSKGSPTETRFVVDELGTTDVEATVKRPDWKSRDWRGSVALRLIHEGKTKRFRLKAKGGLWNRVEPVPRRYARMANKLADELVPEMSKLMSARAPRGATTLVFGAPREYDRNAGLAKRVTTQLRERGWTAKSIPHELELRTKGWARVWFGYVAVGSGTANVRVHARVAQSPACSKSVRIKYDSETTSDAKALTKLATAVTEFVLKAFAGGPA